MEEITWEETVNEVMRLKLFDIYKSSNWEENHILMSLMEKLKEVFSQILIHGDEVKYHSTHWDFYKNNQKKDGLEYEFGDLAVLVKLHFTPQISLEGVAFLEAKRIYFDDDQHNRLYHAIKWDQLERMVTKTPYHRLLLFDLEFVDDDKVNPLILTLPTQHALALSTRSIRLNSYCENFSKTLVKRFFYGFELDYGKEIINQIKGFTDAKHTGVKFLAGVQIGMNPSIELNPDALEVNNSVYSKIGSNGPENTPGGTSGNTPGGSSGGPSGIRVSEDVMQSEQDNVPGMEFNG